VRTLIPAITAAGTAVHSAKSAALGVRSMLYISMNFQISLLAGEAIPSKTTAGTSGYASSPYAFLSGFHSVLIYNGHNVC